jgi:hypothetical protein
MMMSIGCIGRSIRSNMYHQSRNLGPLMLRNKINHGTLAHTILCLALSPLQYLSTPFLISIIDRISIIVLNQPARSWFHISSYIAICLIITGVWPKILSNVLFIYCVRLLVTSIFELFFFPSRDQ